MKNFRAKIWERNKVQQCEPAFVTSFPQVFFFQKKKEAEKKKKLTLLLIDKWG